MRSYEFHELHVVSHTHWDREWYQPFEQTRARLVGVIDRLLETLDVKDNFKAFMLDGQTIVLEDYLEIRPENEDRLRQHISNGRILVGPWYVLSDEFLSSGEATIRNGLIGNEIASRFGNVMKVGYVPDTFGHISQLPQLLRGFGMGSAALFRGVGDKLDDTEALWRAPDGSSVILIHMKNTYGSLANLDPRPEVAAKRIEEELSALVPCGATPYVLLMNGVDHQPAQPDIGDIIEVVRPRIRNAIIEHSTLPAYVRKIEPYAGQMKSIEGELRSKGKHPLLPGVLSTRMYLKQQNYACQIDMEKYVEPLSAFSWLTGGEYDHASLTRAWKYILSNQPHDSICGCSVDDVHREMETRYVKAKRLSEWLIRESAYDLARRIDTRGRVGFTPILAFNTSAARDCDVARVTFWTRDIGKSHYEVIDDAGNTLPYQISSSTVMNWQYVGLFRSIVMEEEDGTAAPFMIAPRDELQRWIDEGKWFLFPVKKVEMNVLLRGLNSCGYGTLWITPAATEPRFDTDLSVSGNCLENTFFRVTVNPDGGVTVLDKLSGVIFDKLNVFVDNADAGDTYNHSPIPNDELIHSTSRGCDWRVVQRGPVKASIEIDIDLQLPDSLAADRRARSRKLVSNRIRTVVTLYAGVERVEFETTFENRAKDHRLRVYFPSGVSSDHSYACGQFDVVEREIKVSEEVLIREGKLPRVDGEAEVATYPQEYFVDVNDGRTGLAVLSKGLPEYEIIPDGNIIALTLVRSVGAMSRSDLLARKGAASPPLETPDAQCLREFVFNYAIVPHAGNQTSERLLSQMQRYHNPLLVIQTDQHAGVYPGELSFVEQDDPRIVLSAMKKCEREDAFIIRMFNISDSSVSSSVSLRTAFDKVYEANLNEETVGELEVLGGVITLSFRPREIKSVKVTPRWGEEP